MRHTIIFALLTCMSFTVFSQNSNDTLCAKDFKHNLGFGLGLTTGYGLSYKYFPEKFGFQTNIGGVKNESVNDFSLGITFLYSLRETIYTNFYIYQSNSYNYNFTYPDYFNSHSTETHSINTGIGFGLELYIIQHLGINGMVGYGATESYKEIGITGEMAIYYKF